MSNSNKWKVRSGGEGADKLYACPQEQRQKLGELLHRRLKLPAVVGRLLGHFQPLLDLHSSSATANKVNSSFSCQLLVQRGFRG